MKSQKERAGVQFDPRTKLLLLVVTVITVATSSGLWQQTALVGVIGGIGILSRRYREVLTGGISYIVMLVLLAICQHGTRSRFDTMLTAWLGLMFQIFPCGMLAGIVMRTTTMGAFLAAMERMRIPRKILVPLAIMVRYLPTIREDWNAIKDAMKLRNVSPSVAGFLAHPAMTIECLYVPLLLAASKAADELAIASVARGIENPGKRTTLIRLHFGIWDALAVCAFFAVMMFGLLQ